MSIERSAAAAGQVTSPADRIASLVEAVPGVVRLHPGAFGEVATYLPGRRVAGVRITDTGTEVHVVADQRVPVRTTAERVHRAVAGMGEGPVHVFIEDIDDLAR